MKTNLKSKYHVELKKFGGIAQEIAVMAIMSNGGKQFSLKDMESMFKMEAHKFPILTQYMTCNLIGEHQLTIDKGTENLLFIEERMMHELVAEDDDELSFPTFTKDELDKLLD